MKLGYTHFCIVLDASGSMSSRRNDVIETLKRFVSRQLECESDEDKVLIDVYQFSDETTQILSSAPMSSFDPSDYQCSGFTALYDAVCIADNELRDKIRQLPERERPEDVAFVIVTDGMENASQRFGLSDVRKRLDVAKKKGWRVDFLADNIDVERTANELGLVEADDHYELCMDNVKEELCDRLCYSMAQIRESRASRR